MAQALGDPEIPVRPQFHSPCKPLGFSDVLGEYCENMHDMGKVLLEGISESLGLDPTHINKLMNIDSSQQLWAAKRYTPCPEPERVMGIPAHTHYGLLTFLTQHGTDGLEIFLQDKWVKVHSIQGAILVNTCDHIEILTYMGMKYKEYFDLMYNPKLFGKSCLEYVKTTIT